MKKLLLLLTAMAFALPGMAQLSSSNASRYYAEFKKYFTDAVCSEMASPYSAMTDDELRTTMSEMPKELIEVALKVKNNSWAKNEKEFRVAKFSPHSDPLKWEKYMKVYTYSLMPCPAGITGNDEDIIIFVGDEAPDDATLGVYKVAGNSGHGFLYNSLKKGLNVIQMPEDTESKMLFIEYYVKTDTTETSKRLADFPEVSMHFEGGHVNGYFDVKKHDDAYWRELLAAHKADSVASSYSAIQVMGERVMFHMERNQIAAVCPNTITDAINWWDDLVKFEHKLMGADRYYDRWNDLIMARNGVGSYMYATQGYTYYENSTLSEILPWASVYESPGRMWGPAHEIGHVNQGAINIVSCTEASNNLFANAAIHNLGKSTTRGSGVAFCMNEFQKRTPFPLRKDDIIGVSRMFFQLYLYFHAVGNDTTFYPRLFDALRNDPIQKGPQNNEWVYQTQAIDDQLKFAEKCCEIAQMDLSEFFEVWGFFEPMTNVYIGDYSNYNVNLTKEEADASRARMQKYEKKGGHLMFIEDRIKPSKREDGVEGNRIDFNDEYAIGKMGNVGQWGDYIDESVKATGYYYAQKSNSIQINTNSNSKGALGFKLYDAESGELLSFSNTYSLAVPAASAGKKLKVVAAQADGTDCEIPNVEDSDDEAMQKEALDALVSSTINYVSYTTTDGSKIGYYYADVVKELKSLRTDAKNAVKKNDTSKHSYKEWIRLIREALNAINENPDAFARIQEYDIYQMQNLETRTYLCNDAMGVTSTNKANEDNARWTIVNSEEKDYFYIMDKNGHYINDIALNGAYCNGRVDAAIMFKAIYNSDCTLSFVTKDGLYLAINSDKMAVGTETLNKNAMWLVTMVEKGTMAVEEIESDNGEKSGDIYDLQGRKVEIPTKGVYIKNGKKVIY